MINGKLSYGFRATDMIYRDAVLEASTAEREKNRVLVTNQFVQQNKWARKRPNKTQH